MLTCPAGLAGCSPTSDNSPSILIPGAITKLNQILQSDRPKVETPEPSSPAPPWSPPQPTSLPFNFTGIQTTLRLPPLPTTTLPADSAPLGLAAIGLSVPAHGASLVTDSRARAEIGGSSPGPPERTGSDGPFTLTSIGLRKASYTESIPETDRQTTKMTRKMSVAGFSSGGRTPRHKRSKTVGLASVAQPARSSEEEEEVRGTWERSGKARPSFGMDAMSD